MLVNVECSGKVWHIRRTLADFTSLDRQIHTCVFDRKFSELPAVQDVRLDDDDDGNPVHFHVTRPLRRGDGVTPVHFSDGCMLVFYWMRGNVGDGVNAFHWTSYAVSSCFGCVV